MCYGRHSVEPSSLERWILGTLRELHAVRRGHVYEWSGNISDDLQKEFWVAVARRRVLREYMKEQHNA